MHLPSRPPSPCQVARPRHDPEFGPSTKKRAPRFKFYKNDLQEWDVSIANLVKAKHGETHEKPSFLRPSFFLLNTILKIVILLTFGAKTGSRLFLGKLLHQHPWHTTRLGHLPEHSKWSLPELWESLRHLERILCCQEAIVSSPFSSSFWIPGGSAGAWSWVPLLVHESGVSIFI